jgi:hypothetical protein
VKKWTVARTEEVLDLMLHAGRIVSLRNMSAADPDAGARSRHHRIDAFKLSADHGFHKPASPDLEALRW